MLKNLSELLYRISKWWVALLSLIVFAGFIATVLPDQAAKADAAYGEDAESPDSSFFYTADQLYAMAESYGDSGRAAYVQARFTFDVIWPLVYTAFLATSISWVLGKAFAPESRWRLANLVPVIGMLFDYLENIAAALVMMRYPDPTPVVDSLASVFTMIKWTFVNGSFVVLLLGAVIAIVVWLREKTAS